MSPYLSYNSGVPSAESYSLYPLVGTASPETSVLTSLRTLAAPEGQRPLGI